MNLSFFLMFLFLFSLLSTHHFFPHNVLWSLISLLIPYDAAGCRDRALGGLVAFLTPEQERKPLQDTNSSPSLCCDWSDIGHLPAATFLLCFKPLERQMDTQKRVFWKTHNVTALSIMQIGIFFFLPLTTGKDMREKSIKWDKESKQGLITL